MDDDLIHARRVMEDEARAAELQEEDLRLSSYDFELPGALIAQRPMVERDDSRLLKMDRATGARSYHRFRELPGLLRAGDVLVLNNTRVIPARLVGRRATGGRVEILLLNPRGEVAPAGRRYAERWEALMRPSARLRIDEVIPVGDGLTAYPEARQGEGWLVRLEADIPILEAIEAAGEIPLPPYIQRHEGQDPTDRERYQTVYARHPGSAAAPTAGLHFTEGLMAALTAAGLELHTLTLHVGAGTFRPVRSERITEHRMHVERYTVPAGLWNALVRAKREGRRIVAVGTTSVRALEAVAQERGGVLEPVEQALVGETSIFIHPGYQFRVVDALVTNFHLPRSSLIMLVSAFAGRTRVLEAYRSAIEQGYRFFSYGDAMLIA